MVVDSHKRGIMDSAQLCEGVSVWADRVAVGETQSLHSHEHPYIAVIITGESGQSLGSGGEVMRNFQFTPGEVLRFGQDAVPVTHALRNTGSEEIHMVIIELITPESVNVPVVG